MATSRGRHSGCYIVLSHNDFSPGGEKHERRLFAHIL